MDHLQDPALVILIVARAVANALQVDERRAGELLRPRAQEAGHPLPEAGPLPRVATHLELSQAVIVLTYAGCALVRGGAMTADVATVDIGRFLGVSPDQLAVAMPAITNAARSAVRLDPTSAVGSFFEPEPWTKELARTIAQRIEFRRDRRPIAHIPPAAYEHPDDRSALEAVRSVTGVETALRKLSELGVEKTMAIDNLGNSIRVGPRQFPELYALFCDAVDMLAMPQRPELFIAAMSMGAHTVGVQNPRVVLSNTLPSLLTRDELLFVIGHELGHIRSGHAPFLLLRRVLPQLAEIAGQMTLGLGALLGVAMQAAVFDWYRKSELTCDRCGLLVAQNSDAAMSAFMKIAGAPIAYYRQLNIDAFVEQADDYDRLDTSALSKFYKLTNSLNQDHPWLTVRARELLRWVGAGQYDRLLDSAVALRCNSCSAPLTDGDLFCSSCGSRRVGAAPPPAQPMPQQALPSHPTAALWFRQASELHYGKRFTEAVTLYQQITEAYPGTIEGANAAVQVKNLSAFAHR